MYGTSVFCLHLIQTRPGFEKNSVVFLSFVVRFRLIILFYSNFSIYWLDFFSNIWFSNRRDFILRIKLSLSPRVIWSLLVVRIACFTWKTFLSLNCCFTSFSSLKPYINGPQIIQCIKFSFSLTAGARFRLHREFFCLQPSLAWLYSAVASPSERLRSDGSLAMRIKSSRA